MTQAKCPYTLIWCARNSPLFCRLNNTRDRGSEIKSLTRCVILYINTSEECSKDRRNKLLISIVDASVGWCIWWACEKALHYIASDFGFLYMYLFFFVDKAFHFPVWSGQVSRCCDFALYFESWISKLGSCQLFCIFMNDHTNTLIISTLLNDFCHKLNRLVLSLRWQRLHGWEKYLHTITS